METSPPAQGITRRVDLDRWTAIAIIALAAVLRLWGIGTNEVLTDEGNYAMRAIGWNDFHYSTTLQTPWVWMQESQRLPAWTQLSFADHPPLHFAIIWLFTHLLGISLAVVRLPSVLFGVGSVALVIAVGKQLGWGRASLIAGAFIAFLPWHIYISQQAIQEAGVMFWLLLGIWAWIKYQRATWAGPVITGLAFGAAMLTKYSAIIWVPVFALLVWRIPRRRWWVAVLVAMAMMSPVIIYNQQLITLRGHFDLQIARFFGQDTNGDWSASQQGLWQGKLANLGPYVSRQLAGIGLPIALGIAGVLLYLAPRRGKQWVRDAGFWLSIGMSVFVAALALVTLDDYGRGSIVIPFYALAVGFVTSQLTTNRLPVVGVVVCLLLLLGSFGDRLGAELVPEPVLATFADEKRPRGFAAWEDWRADAVPTRFVPRHYHSLLDFFATHAKRLADPSVPLIVYDGRITWFQLNWYFYRYSSYARDVVVLPANIFSVLVANRFVADPPARTFDYVQVADAALDEKPSLDPFGVAADATFFKLASAQATVPTVLTAVDGRPLLRIFRLKWNDDTVLEPVRLPNQP